MGGLSRRTFGSRIRARKSDFLRECLGNSQEIKTKPNDVEMVWIEKQQITCRRTNTLYDWWFSYSFCHRNICRVRQSSHISKDWAKSRNSIALNAWPSAVASNHGNEICMNTKLNWDSNRQTADSHRQPNWQQWLHLFLISEQFVSSGSSFSIIRESCNNSNSTVVNTTAFSIKCGRIDRLDTHSDQISRPLQTTLVHRRRRAPVTVISNCYYHRQLILLSKCPANLEYHFFKPCLAKSKLANIKRNFTDKIVNFG